MDRQLAMLEELAQGAAAHALVAHGLVLTHGDFATADQALMFERQAGLSPDEEMLSNCYGAWFGAWAQQELAAAWTGLNESFSPRLRIGDRFCSPIDAVRRFLRDKQSLHGTRWMADLVSSWKKTDRDAVVLHNQQAWDQLSDHPRFAGMVNLPNSAREALDAVDPWLQEIWKPSMRLLCLCAGGGKHAPLFALAGADVTVVDISERQLQHDRVAAETYRLKLRVLQASGDSLAGLGTNEFDAVVQPVSANYLPSVQNLYRDVARVLKPGGNYLLQHKNPVSLALNYMPNQPNLVTLTDPSMPKKISLVPDSLNFQREPGTCEFAHSLDDLIGGLCRAGFVIDRFAEPPLADAFAPLHTAQHQACFVPPYFKIRSRKAHCTDSTR